VKTPYWREGWFGRGLIQLTHKANYDKFGVTKEQALDLKTSVRVVFDGMEQGLFTGRKLSDYDNVVTKTPRVVSFLYYSSRAIVNGDTAENGSKINAYGKAFEAALKAAGYAGAKTAPVPVDPVQEQREAADAFARGEIKRTPQNSTPASSGGWASFWAAVLTMFNRSK
jgi:putative chitinase